MSQPAPAITLQDLPLSLNVDEAAAVLRVSTDVIYDAVKTGQIKAARIGPKRIIRIHRATIERMLNGES